MICEHASVCWQQKLISPLRLCQLYFITFYLFYLFIRAWGGVGDALRQTLKISLTIVISVLPVYKYYVYHS